jgi:molybdopterin/thiamine biosynthesis adenylyltransferase
MSEHTIRISYRDYQHLVSHLFPEGVLDEQGAFMLAGQVATPRYKALLVREVFLALPEHVLSQSGGFIEFHPDFVAMIIKQARLKRLSLIEVHSHPFSTSTVGFSGIDNHWQKPLFSRILQRVPGMDQCALVFGRDSFTGRIWLSGGDIVPMKSIKVLGSSIQEYLASAHIPSLDETISDTYSRQVLALGEEGQVRIQRVTVGVVGVGGTGSHVIQQLAHLGVRNFILVDNDVVERSNRSRIVGSRPDDSLGSLTKVKVMERLIKEVNPEAEVLALQKSVDMLDAINALRDADVVFGCTDNLASRGILNAFAYQFLIPVIDTGVEVQPTTTGIIRAVGGRISLLLPDNPCLRCQGLLNPDKVNRELENEQHLSYLGKERVPSPSVISFNGVVSSLAVTEFLQLFTDFAQRDDQRIFWMYDGMKGRVRAIPLDETERCPTCWRFLGLGDRANPNDWLYESSTNTGGIYGEAN